MSKKEMFCRLDETHITEDGDCIPKGTPVRVLCWSPEKEGFIRVETKAHIHSDSSDSRYFDHGIEYFPSCVEYGLLIDVNPNSITFSSLAKGK